MSKSNTIGVVPWIFLMWLIWQPIIINSQPGNSFVYAGVDWKADNLDNTMFWLGLLLLLVTTISLGYTEHKEDKRAERLEKSEQYK